jgi:hypothetical protein
MRVFSFRPHQPSARRVYQPAASPERSHEVIRRRAKYEPADAIPVAAPAQLGDRSTHRVADRDERLDTHVVGDGVVGTVGQAEVVRANPAPVATVMDDDHAEAFGQRGARQTS